MHFQILDLPISVRMRIYRFTFGFRVIHVDHHNHVGEQPRNTYHVCNSGTTISLEDSETIIGQKWSEGTMIAPLCEYRHDDAFPAPTLQLNMLRACKQIYAEAKEVLVADNIFTFSRQTAFTNFLVAEPQGRVRAAVVTKMGFMVDPKTPQTHFLNLALGQLYLPHGIMSSPDSHFPALKMLQLCFNMHPDYPRPGFREWEKWSNMFWVWGFLYFTIEELEQVDVVVAEEYVVRNLEWRQGGDGQVPEWVRPEEDEVSEYKEVLEERLLETWMGGDQDEIEEVHLRYDMRTRGLGFDDLEDVDL